VTVTVQPQAIQSSRIGTRKRPSHSRWAAVSPFQSRGSSVLNPVILTIADNMLMWTAFGGGAFGACVYLQTSVRDTVRRIMGIYFIGFQNRCPHSCFTGSRVGRNARYRALAKLDSHCTQDSNARYRTASGRQPRIGFSTEAAPCEVESDRNR
jgi:hypothetical protein